MSAIVDIKGKTFGLWKVIGFSHQKGSMLYWDCKCECGTRRAVFGGDLKRGQSTNCGCQAKKKMVARQTTHSMSRHPAYRSYVYMRARCLNEDNEGYYLYGGRGIKICEKWLRGFEHFWADMGPTWKSGASIERNNVDGNYEPSNCSWAFPLEQSLNRRSNRIINTPKGPMPVTVAAQVFGLSSVTIQSRIRYGWLEEDLLKPVDIKKRKKTKRKIHA